MPLRIYDDQSPRMPTESPHPPTSYILTTKSVFCADGDLKGNHSFSYPPPLFPPKELYPPLFHLVKNPPFQACPRIIEGDTKSSPPHSSPPTILPIFPPCCPQGHYVAVSTTPPSASEPLPRRDHAPLWPLRYLRPRRGFSLSPTTLVIMLEMSLRIPSNFTL